MWRWLLMIVILFGIATGLVLGVLNPGKITLELAFFELKASLGVVVAAAVGLGLVIGLCIGIVLRPARRRLSSTPSIHRDRGVSRTDA